MSVLITREDYKENARPPTPVSSHHAFTERA